MGDRLRAGMPPRYVTKPTRLTQPCILLGSLNRILALIGWGTGWNVTSAGWQVTLCDPIWQVSSRSGVVLVAQTAIRFLTLPYRGSAAAAIAESNPRYHRTLYGHEAAFHDTDILAKILAYLAETIQFTADVG